MSDTITTRQVELVEEFAMFDDWMDRYSYIIDMAEELQEFPKQDQRPENLIKGCQSKVWLTSEMNKGKVTFRASSDAIITKGLVAMMVRILSDSTPQEIVEADLYFIKEIGLQEHLSPTRSNGLAAMVKQMKFYALAFQGVK